MKMLVTCRTETVYPFNMTAKGKKPSSVVKPGKATVAASPSKYSDVPREYRFESWWHEQGSADWVVVAEKVKDGEDLFGTSWLLANDPAMISGIFRKVDFDGHIGDGLPDFDQSSGKITYLPYGTSPLEPQAFVIWREFHGLYPQELAILQEFVFYHKLYFDPAARNYIEPISLAPVVMYEEGGLKIKVSMDHLRDFLAARNQVLVRAFDNRLRRKVDVVPEIEVEVKNPDAFFRLTVGQYDDRYHDTNLFCLLRGKYLVRPYREPKHKSYRGLLDRHTDRSPKVPFIVGKDEGGQPVAAHTHHDAGYLTPVFFRKALLEKYHNNPRLYRVDERMIWYLSEWSIAYGLNDAGLVHVWLGDLWRDMPYEEQQYWASFNVLPTGGLEPAFWTTQMEAEFAESDRIDRRILRAREALADAFNLRFGFHLFREIPQDEQFITSNLHVPHSPELREFNEQISYLAKLFVEALDKDAIEARVQSKQELLDKDGNKKASIQVLEVFFRDAAIDEGQRFCDQLRAVQSIRSKMPAHLTSKSEQVKLFARLGLESGRSLPEIFYKLLERILATIEGLTDVLRKPQP